MTQRMLAIGLIMVGALAGCSLLTKPEQGAMHCEIHEDDDGVKIDPCPEKLYCLKGVCQPEDCAEDAVEDCKGGIGVDDDCDDKVDEENDASTEICDNRDNDCDGKTDEGYDDDGDEYTWCGDGRERSTKDCDEGFKEVHPGHPEVCDGLNNDCVGMADDGPDGGMLWCDAGSLCSNGRCEVPSCAIPGSGIKCKANEACIEARCVVQTCSPACKENEFCDMATRTCMPQPPKKSGQGCTLDNDCDQSTVKLVCFERAALGLGPAAPTRGLCSIACCTDSDCGPDETCYLSGTGTRACLPKSSYMNVGTATRCTFNQDCPSSAMTTQYCSHSLLGEVATTTCRVPTSSERKIGEPCAVDGNCVSKMCVDGNFLQMLCTAPCQRSGDCMPLEAAVERGFAPATPYCGYVDLGTFDPRYSRQFAPVCQVARGRTLGSGRNGAECIDNYDCASNVCLGGSSEGKGRCADTCCTDAHCTPGATGAPALRCRPVVRGVGRYEMRCLAR